MALVLFHLLFDCKCDLIRIQFTDSLHFLIKCSYTKFELLLLNPLKRKQVVGTSTMLIFKCYTTVFLQWAKSLQAVCMAAFQKQRNWCIKLGMLAKFELKIFKLCHSCVTSSVVLSCHIQNTVMYVLLWVALVVVSADFMLYRVYGSRLAGCGSCLKTFCL